MRPASEPVRHFPTGTLPAEGVVNVRGTPDAGAALVGGCTTRSGEWELWIRSVNDTEEPGEWVTADRTSSPAEIANATFDT